jgi:CTP:molybdopterin cytidylyltransferase MocA
VTRLPARWPGLRGLVLAAGGSRRLGHPKQAVRIDGVPLIRRIVRMVTEVCDGPVVVVLGASSERVANCLQGTNFIRVDNRRWQSGLGSSLARGLEALEGRCRAALVTACDLPCLSKEDLETLAAAWDRKPDRPAAARYEGVLGTPAILPARVFPDLAEARGDVGARDYLRRPDLSVTPVDLAGAALDLDSHQDLDGIRRLSGANRKT